MKKIFLGLGVLVLGVLIIFGAYSWFLQKQERVLNGTARPDFPYRDYSDSELEKLYPHDAENTAPTVQSPEQTHEKFLAALKREDFNEAVNCCFREGDRAKIKTGLLQLQKSGDLKQMIKDLDTDIKLDLDGSMTKTFRYSSVRNGKRIGTTIDFIKTSNGYWYIESL